MSYFLVFASAFHFFWGAAHILTQLVKGALMCAGKTSLDVHFKPAIKYFLYGTALMLLAIYLNHFPRLTW